MTLLIWIIFFLFFTKSPAYGICFENLNLNNGKKDFANDLLIHCQNFYRVLNFQENLVAKNVKLPEDRAEFMVIWSLFKSHLFDQIHQILNHWWISFALKGFIT